LTGFFDAFGQNFFVCFEGDLTVLRLCFLTPGIKPNIFYSESMKNFRDELFQKNTFGKCYMIIEAFRKLT